MAYAYSELVNLTQRWAARPDTAVWLNSTCTQLLQQLDAHQPERLFASDGIDTRPLIVAFMGGTGVGKSTLLNRLAGKAIAQAGIVRPTSKEVTLYHHHSISLNPHDGLPLDHIKLAHHHDDHKKNLVWIDMPDFDSTEHSNKQLVLQWLPHIDVLIYVVSPERYRDEKAWRLLLAEGAKHAWLFVINQWDRGQTAQYDDFCQQLHKAGFNAPIIYTTACTDSPQTDQFAELETTISRLANSHTIDQLEQRGLQVRKLELQQTLRQIASQIGTPQILQQLPALWQQQWQHTLTQLQQGLAWPIKQLAVYYAEHTADLLAQPSQTTPPLWDDFAQARFDDALDAFINHIDALELPPAPFKQLLAPLRLTAAKTVHRQTELAVRMALVQPGNALHRGFLKLMRFAELTLPLAAMTWVGSKVFLGYYASDINTAHYLGVDFAIHSSLLIAMTWLIPFFILKKAQPSLQKSALKGLNKGLQNAFNHLEAEVLSALAQQTQHHQTLAAELQQLIAHCAETNTPAQSKLPDDSPLARMLVGGK